jgi:lysophospholipase L1-like esterase
MACRPDAHDDVQRAQGVVRSSRVVQRRRLVALSGVLALGSVVAGSTHSGAVNRTPTHAATTTVPRVLAVHPGTIHGRGGTTLLVLGRSFTTATSITVGGRHARVLSVRNPHAVYAVAPRGIGTEVVRAVTSGGTSTANARSVLHFDTRVLVVGDSLGIDLGWGFTPSLDVLQRLSVTDDAVGSSGLVRPDFYDWSAHLRADIRDTHPDVVVTMFGTNDQQAIRTSKGLFEPGTVPWDRAYGARIRQIAAIVHHARATLVWVGLPRMGPGTDLNPQFVAHLDALDRSVVAKLSRAMFIDSWLVFTTASGAYTPYVEVAPRVWAIGHAPDGTHLTPAGATVIDDTVVQSLRSRLTRR